MTFVSVSFFQAYVRGSTSRQFAMLRGANAKITLDKRNEKNVFSKVHKSKCRSKSFSFIFSRKNDLVASSGFGGGGG